MISIFTQTVFVKNNFKNSFSKNVFLCPSRCQCYIFCSTAAGKVADWISSSAVAASCYGRDEWLRYRLAGQGSTREYAKLALVVKDPSTFSWVKELYEPMEDILKGRNGFYSADGIKDFVVGNGAISIPFSRCSFFPSSKSTFRKHFQ